MTVKNHNHESNKILAVKYYLQNNVSQKEVSKIFNITR